jgi:hypothetical protein
MKEALKCLALALACVALLAVSVLLWRVNQQADAATRSLNQALANMVKLTDSLNDPKTGLPAVLDALSGKHGVKQILYNVDTVTAQIGRSSNTSRLLVRDQRAALQADQKALLGTLDDARAMVANLDQAVNGKNGAIPALTTDLLKTGTAIDELTGINGVLQQSALTLKQTGTDVHAILADPELQTIIHNLALTSDNVNGTAANLKLVTMDAHNLLNPKKPTFWEGIAETAARSVLGAAAGPIISHFWPLGINVENTVTVSPAK